MGAVVKYKYGTEAQILALQPTDAAWVDRAFYYPEDKDYFFQALNGAMKKYGSGESSGVGVQLNEKYLSGIKTKILNTEILTIPENYDYNTFTLDVEGIINCDGQINIF